MPSKRLIPYGGLNKDVDKYNMPEGDYIDANNVIIDTSLTGGSGSLKTFPNIVDVTDATLGDLLDVGWSIKAAVSDNEGNIYVLLIDSDEAVLGKIDTSNSYTPLVLYTHEVNTDFQPDLRVVGEVVVWNYHGNGTPLSWYVEMSNGSFVRTPVTDGSIVLKDITLIKEPPKMEFSLSPIAASAAPTDIEIDPSSFAESLSSGGSIGTFTITDGASSTHTITIISAVDGGASDASSRFTIGGVGNNELLTVGTFDYTVVNDRTFTLNIKVVNEFGLSYVEPFTITLTNVAPTISVADASLDENGSAGELVVTPLGNNGSANGTDNNCTYSITAGNGQGLFAIDASTGAITTTGPLDAESLGNPYTLTVQIDDGTATATDTTVITVSNINEAPVTTDGSALLLTNPTYNGNLGLLTTDPEGDTLTYSTVSGVGNGDLTITNATTGAFTYIAGGTSSADSFTYKANDGALDSNISTFNLSFNLFDMASQISYIADHPDVTGASILIGDGNTKFQGGVNSVNRVINFSVTIAVNISSVPADLADVVFSITNIGTDVSTIVENTGIARTSTSNSVKIAFTLTMNKFYLAEGDDLSFDFQVSSLSGGGLG